MSVFYRDCRLCSLSESPCPEKCFGCAEAAPSSFGWLHSLGIYFPRRQKNSRYMASSWSQAVIRLKGKHAPFLSVFGRILSWYLRTKLKHYEPYVLTHVPGFTPQGGYLFPCVPCSTTQLLAIAASADLAGGASLAVNGLLVQQKSKTRKQRHCSTVRQRAHNVAGIYALKAPRRVQGKNVVVVDDVVTSGATFRECRSVLIGAGAAEVLCIALARSHKQDN